MEFGPIRTMTRTALITGASRRIGAELARDFARRGWRVAIHYRTARTAAETLVDELRAHGVESIPLMADLRDDGAVRDLIPRCAKALGAPDCLVNNASDFEYDDVTTLDPDRWAQYMDVNLKAPVFLAKALASNLSDGQTGNVVNIIDQRVWRLTPDFFSYTLSKAGLWAATRMLAQGLAPRVRVNAVGPGPVLPNVHQEAGDFEEEWRSTPLRRAIEPGEIATAVRFIIDAPAMTGQMIALDGGQHLGWSLERRRPGAT
jgi:NAD(P)-dependent dehydrogenase (short-subunit alcohol dehydrogenase family)